MTTRDELQAGVDYVNDVLRTYQARIDAGEDLEPGEWEAVRDGLAYVADGSDVRRQLALHDQLADMTRAGRGEPGDYRPPAVNVNRNDDPFDLSGVSVVTSGVELRARARTAIERVSHLDDKARAAATDLIDRVDTPGGALARHVLAVGSDAYRSAFVKVIGNAQYALDDAERHALTVARALSLSDAAGGFAVPFTLDPTIIDTRDGTVNPFRQISRIVTTVTDSWNGVSSGGVTAAWAAEGVEAGDNSPTLAQPSVPVHKAHAFVPFSVEIGGDWAAIETDLRNMFSNAKDDLEAAAFAVGTGSGQPTGIVTALDGTSSEITSTTTDVFALGDVYRTLEATGPRYRSRGSWVANLSVLNLIRQFGTANNYHGFTVDLTAEGIPAVLGRPLYEASGMDGVINATQDNNILVFGDFEHYVIADRVGMSVELVPHLFHTANNRPSGQRGFYAWWRVGADSVNDAAFTLLNVT